MTPSIVTRPSTDTTAETEPSAMAVDIPATLAHLASAGAARFGDSPAQRFMDDGVWQELSYAELDSVVEEMASGLAALGIEPGDRVSILAETGPEWAQAQLACAAAGAVVVPIYPTSSPEECEWVLSDSGAVAVFCGDAALLAKIEHVRHALTNLKHVVLFKSPRSQSVAGSQSLAELRKLGGDDDRAEVRRRIEASAPNDPILIIYTSGTTGRPKGCVLTDRNLMYCVSTGIELDLLRPDDVTYLFLPLAHVYAQIVNIDVLAVGATVAYCSAGVNNIMSDLADLKPAGFPAVPRIFEKIYAKFADSVGAEQLSALVRATLTVRELEEAGRPVSDELREGVARGEPLFAAARQAFGGRIELAITGAAPIAPEILEFFHAAGVPILEGYGLSESTATGTVNRVDAWRVGTVGLPTPGVEVRVDSDGELLMRGPNVFAGYWNNPAATAETLVDGWLRTGDLAEIDEDGFVRIIGRKKDIIITAGGENITPSSIENDLRQYPFISQAVMYGDRRPYPVALITLDADYVVPWAQQRGLPTDLSSLTGLDEVRQLVAKAVDRVNAQYKRAAQIKQFAILDHDFSPDSGELTLTLKLKRRVVYEKYAAVVDGLYAQPR